MLLETFLSIYGIKAISKILEKVVHLKLYMNNILSDTQYGFHKHSNFILQTVTKYESQENTLAVFIDLLKAFDTINHEILLGKKSHYSIIGTSLSWFKSYLSDRMQFVLFQRKESKMIYPQIDCEVPQGSILGPLLFLIYINKLPSCLMFSKAILLADDTTLYYSSSDINLYHSKVNTDLHGLVEWFRANYLSLIKYEQNTLSIFNTV